MKKLKLLLSLAMMCLSIAVLCFGVFSAVSVSYSISGTISYTVNDAFVKVNTVVYKGTNQYTTDSVLETLAENLESSTTTTKLTDAGFTEDTSFNVPEYNSTSSENFEKTGINFNLSSTIKSYLVEMTIANLSPSVKVWANANWTLSDNANISQGNNSSHSNIEKGSPKCIYFIVSIKDMTQAVSEISYTMGLDIGIGERPIEATSDGNTITATEGMTWETYISNNSGYSTTVKDSVTYVTKDNKILKKDWTNVQITEEIVEGAEYLTKWYSLKNSTCGFETCWCIEMGTLSDGTPIKWKLVSLDGKSRYEYTSEEPEVDTGAIFLQVTYTEGCDFDACDDTSRSDYNNYYKSDIREKINTPETWNITQSQMSSLVTPRDIAQIEGSSGDVVYTKPDNDDITDYFWLLSSSESEQYISMRPWYYTGSDGNIYGREYWLRTPVKNKTSEVKVVWQSGDVENSEANDAISYNYNISYRAAFQLA